jgi:outer membrane protein OmpA-like peptidoglycan-associated protein
MQKFVVLSALIFCLNYTLDAQSNLVAKGDKFMSLFQFEKAASFYKKAADADLNNISAWDKLGQAFIMNADLQSAESIYKVLSENPLSSHEAKFRYAQLLRANGKYEEAQKAYESFAKAMPYDTRADEFLNFSEQIKNLSQDLKAYELVSIPENSVASEIGPAYRNGNLTFSSNRKGNAAVKVSDNWSQKPYYDVFTMEQTSTGELASPSKAKGKVNRRLNEGPVTFSADGKLMIFTRSNYKKKGENGIRKLGLYSATYNERSHKWEKIQPLPFNSSEFNNAHPSLSPDGTKLYFTSDMPGGQGETDIYMSIKNGSTWENPINLGKEVNTAGREMFPFISELNNLFFSSDSRIGLGGLDILAATFENGKWGNVINPGVPLNSSSDDFGYICNATGKEGYMVSNRPGGIGGDDIYKFTKRSESVCGKVIDAKTKKVLENVMVKASSDDGLTTGSKTSQSGSYCLQLPVEREFKVTTSVEGYAPYQGKVSALAFGNPAQDIYLFPVGGIDLIVDVADKNGTKISDANAFLVNKKTGEVVQGTTDANGLVKFDLYKDQEYDVKVVKRSANKDSVYTKFVKAISTLGYKPSQRLEEKVELAVYDAKYAFDLPNIFFDYNKYDLNEGAKAELDKVIKVMNEFPDVEIELSAHTDSRGSSNSNLQLSAMRAQACVTYMESKNVNLTKLIAVGFGEMKIRNKCIDYVPCTDKEHAQNRRIEFKVVKFD